MKHNFFQKINYEYSRVKMRYRIKKQHRKGQHREKQKNTDTTKIHKICKKIFDIKPKKEDDYYSVMGLRIGKKIGLWILFIVALVSIAGIVMVVPKSGFTDGIRTYRYNALPLRYTSGQVRILAKSGYVAYEGEISKGAANGQGTLYRKDGSIVYEGELKNNQYQGKGKYYFDGIQLQYEGEFVNNKYQGQGILYRKDGSKEYEGTFSAGEKQGEGKLYNTAGSLIYSGNFVKDRVRYQELLGKSVTQAAKMYTGKRVVYENDNSYCVSMEEIDSLYISEGASNTLEQEGIVQGVYVLSPSIVLEGVEYKAIKELKKKFKLISYEGNTSLSMADAVAVNVAAAKTPVLNGEISMDTESMLDDVITVNRVDESYEAYIYRLEDDNIVYTFFCKEKGQEFDFYFMEQK